MRCDVNVMWCDALFRFGNNDRSSFLVRLVWPRLWWVFSFCCWCCCWWWCGSFEHYFHDPWCFLTLAHSFDYIHHCYCHLHLLLQWRLFGSRKAHIGENWRCVVLHSLFFFPFPLHQDLFIRVPRTLLKHDMHRNLSFLKNIKINQAWKRSMPTYPKRRSRYTPIHPSRPKWCWKNYKR